MNRHTPTKTARHLAQASEQPAPDHPSHVLQPLLGPLAALLDVRLSERGGSLLSPDHAPTGMDEVLWQQADQRGHECRGTALGVWDESVLANPDLRHGGRCVRRHRDHASAEQAWSVVFAAARRWQTRMGLRESARSPVGDAPQPASRA